MNLIYDGTRPEEDCTGWYWGSTGWLLVVLRQYEAVLVGIKWYWVSYGLLCLYILTKAEIWKGVTIAGRTTNDKQTTKDRAS